MNEKIWALRDMIEQSRSIVFFGGAGVSTESGIPDFRSVDSPLYEKNDFGRQPEELLHKDTLRRLPTQFFTYYRQQMLHPRARPNDAHRVLVELEQRGKLEAVITQNVDGLHQLAGARRVLELHGSSHRNHCVVCREPYPLSYVLQSESVVPRCKRCGGVVRPDIVLYGEALRLDVIEAAKRLVEDCDMLIVGGTSLVVYPAAGLLMHYLGDKLVLINKGQTGYDGNADLVIHDNIGKVLSEALSHVRWEQHRLIAGGKA